MCAKISDRESPELVRVKTSVGVSSSQYLARNLNLKDDENTTVCSTRMWAEINKKGDIIREIPIFYLPYILT